jgi:hypothetical protein
MQCLYADLHTWACVKYNGCLTCTHSGTSLLKSVPYVTSSTQELMPSQVGNVAVS